MALLVDTSVWSLAFRRDAPQDVPEVARLRAALRSGEDVAATGMVLLELLRGFVPERAQQAIRDAFAVITLLEPSRPDYIAAAGVANECRRHGVQLSSVDALIAQLAIAGDHLLLTTDKDFLSASRHIELRVWRPA